MCNGVYMQFLKLDKCDTRPMVTKGQRVMRLSVIVLHPATGKRMTWGSWLHIEVIYHTVLAMVALFSAGL